MSRLPEHMIGMPKVYLQQGELIFTRDPVVVQTTLGSCVSIMLHDPESELGAVCHAVFPEAKDGDERSARYVDVAIEQMLARFTSEGVPLGRIMTKVVGGACTAHRGVTSARFQPVGQENVRIALRDLANRGLTLTSQDTGGARGRRLLYIPTTGEAFVRKLKRPLALED